MTLYLVYIPVNTSVMVEGRLCRTSRPSNNGKWQSDAESNGEASLLAILPDLLDPIEG